METDTAQGEIPASASAPPGGKPSPENTAPSFSENSPANDQWGDYEDDTYDDGGAKTDAASPAEQNSNLQEDYDHLHSVLFHRYDREIQKMHSLKTQSVFILTALGFLITTGLAILSADWFTIENMPLSITFILLYLVPILILSSWSGYKALKVMLRIDKNTKYEDEYLWDYPDNETLKMSESTSPQIFVDKRVLCRTLAYTIQHNYENNKIMSAEINKAFLLLIGDMICSFVVIAIIMSIHYLV